MKTKSYFVTNSSSVSFILSDIRDEGGDIIVHFNVSKEYNIVELTKEEVESGEVDREILSGSLTESEQTQLKDILDRGGRAHICCNVVDERRLMDFLEKEKGITVIRGN